MYHNKNLYLISALSEASLTLAQSIRKNDSNSLIMFADVTRGDYSELILKAKEIKCRIHHNSIRNIPDRFFRGQGAVNFVLNKTDEDENVNDALYLSEKYKNKIPAGIYVFASSKESECLIDAMDKGDTLSTVPPLKVRRVNTIRNQIYNELFKHSIFDNAVEIFNEKVISVMIAGLGNYGTEILKALLWCGQMTGYVLKVNVFDISETAEEKFYLDCPGVRQRGTQPKNGEDYYEITFHNGIDVFSETFIQKVKELGETTQVFAALGNEQKNIELSLKLRSVFSGMQIDSGLKPMHSGDSTQRPRIMAVVHNNHKAELLNGNKLSNFKNQYYDIKCIGSDNETYSFENIFASNLEKMALRAHLQWGDEESFNKFEYYRRSSMASAIHRKYRDQLLAQDDDLKAMAEHIRWCAYMRSTEGYSFGYIRDDLALRHSSLVKYSLLSTIEKEKDARMNSYNMEDFDI